MIVRSNHGLSGYAFAGGYGMGDALQQSASVLQSSGAIISGLALGHVGWATAAIPIVGPVIAGVTVALGLIASRKGPKQKTYTTQVVNEVEPHLVTNLEGYMAGPRTRSSQIQALANFDAGWQMVLNECGRADLGKPGQNCISERQAGSCNWKDSAGKCFNWFAAYRDPIENDPNVKPDPLGSAGGDLLASGAGAVAGVLGDVLAYGPALWVPLSLLAVAVVVANAD